MQKVETGDRSIRRIAQKLPQEIKENKIPSVIDE